MRVYAVEPGIAPVNQRQPERVPPVRRDSIWEAREIVDEYFRLSLLWSRQPKTAYAVAAGVVNQHKGLIRAYRDSICKVEIAQEHPRLFGAWIVCHEAAVGLMLQ